MDAIVIFSVVLAIFFVVATFVILIIKRPPKQSYKNDGEIKSSDLVLDDQEDDSAFYSLLPIEKMEKNPYIAGNAIDKKELFFGRDDTIDYIRNLFINTDGGQPLVLYGERRIGKSSLLIQLERYNRLGDEFIPIYISMDVLAASNDFNLAGTILNEIAQGVIRKLNLSMNDDEFDFRANNIDDAFNHFESFLKKIRNDLLERFIAVLIDEYEILDEKIKSRDGIDERFHVRFKALMDAKNKICFIFTGSPSLQRSKELGHFFYKGDFRVLEFLTAREARDLIVKPVSDWVGYREAVIARIMSLTSNHPYYIQCICKELILIMKQKGKNIVTLDDLEEALKNLLINAPPHLHYIWTSLASRDKKIIVAVLGQLLANNEYVSPEKIKTTLKENYNITIESDSIGDILSWWLVQEYRILKKHETQDLYCFRVKLVQKLVASEFSVQTALSEEKRGF
jgi:AAA+ ATPase superfamily predicted ATPase